MSEECQLSVDPSAIDFGCLRPGVGAMVIIRVEGGPARATTNNERIEITPSEVGQEPMDIEVAIKDGSDGELIWDTLYIKGDRGELEVPVICMWGEALSRSFKQSARRTGRRKVTQRVEPEEQTESTEKYDTESKDETEFVGSPVTEKPLLGVATGRTYIAQSCPYCGKNFRYDSDNKMWLKCETCAGARKLISFPRRAKALTKLGIVYAKQDLTEIWDVITGKQDWNLR